MDSVIDSIVSLANILFSLEILNIPIAVWLVMPTILGFIWSFISGGNKNEGD